MIRFLIVLLFFLSACTSYPTKVKGDAVTDDNIKVSVSQVRQVSKFSDMFFVAAIKISNKDWRPVKFKKASVSFDEKDKGKYTLLQGEDLVNFNRTMKTLDIKEGENYITDGNFVVIPERSLTRYAVFYNSKSIEGFKTFGVDFVGEKGTKDLGFTVNLDPRSGLAKTKRYKNRHEQIAAVKCSTGSKVMNFRGMKIKCLDDCVRVHPLNQKNCQSQYKRKYMN